MQVTSRYEPLGDILFVVLRSTAFERGAAAGVQQLHSFAPPEILTCDHETPQLRFRKVFTALRSGESAAGGHWVGVVKSRDHMFGILNDSTVAWHLHSPLEANPVFVNDTVMSQTVVMYVKDPTPVLSLPAPSPSLAQCVTAVAVSDGRSTSGADAGRARRGPPRLGLCA